MFKLGSRSSTQAGSLVLTVRAQPALIPVEDPGFDGKQDLVKEMSQPLMIMDCAADEVGLEGRLLGFDQDVMPDHTAAFRWQQSHLGHAIEIGRGLKVEIEPEVSEPLGDGSARPPGRKDHTPIESG